MNKKLPARPNLEHLRTQAKALLTRLRRGDAEAARLFAEHLPEAAGLPPAGIAGRDAGHGYRLADAQAVVARSTGFAAWPGLARHVERLRSLEGKWAFRSLEIDGQTLPASMLAASFLLIDGDRFRMESPEASYEGIFTIDVEAPPHRIDIDFVEGPEAGRRSEGLFELDGDRFRICLGLAGAARPERFATARGSGHALEELVRVERARPVGVDGGTPPPPPPEPAPEPDAEDFDAPPSPAVEQLQGEWTPLELINSGNALPAGYLAFGYRTQSGAETKVVFGGQTMVHAKMQFNEDAAPVQVDYLHLAGPAKGSISLGVFLWDGELAVFCMAAPGAPRPSDFTCGAGSGRTFSRWKRKN